MLHAAKILRATLNSVVKDLASVGATRGKAIKVWRVTGLPATTTMVIHSHQTRKVDRTEVRTRKAIILTAATRIVATARVWSVAAASSARAIWER